MWLLFKAEIIQRIHIRGMMQTGSIISLVLTSTQIILKSVVVAYQVNFSSIQLSGKREDAILTQLQSHQGLLHISK
jgi:hypothetical protein